MLAPSLLFNDLYLDPWFPFNDRRHNNKNIMSTDINEKDSEFELKVDLPGFDKEEINIELKKGYLTINATKEECSDEEETKSCNYIRRERYCGTCSRSFYVGDDIEVDDIKAKFKHGVLTLNIPKKEHKEIEDKQYVTIEG